MTSALAFVQRRLVASYVVPVPYVAPELNADVFNCPHCHAHAKHYWSDVFRVAPTGNVDPVWPTVRVAQCNACSEYSIWLADDQTMIHPALLTAAEPHDELTGDALACYQEARAVASASPRAAAALLRLSLQHLVTQLGIAPDTNLNTAVGQLVKQGLNDKVRKAMDAVRLLGNEGVHPGTIDINEDPALVLTMFELINVVVEAMIAEPKRVDAIYDGLPATKRDQIIKRDATS